MSCDTLSVYDIKLEIARRLEHMRAFNPPTGDNADHHNQGVIQGLDSLWNFIKREQAKEDK